LIPPLEEQVLHISALQKSGTVFYILLLWVSARIVRASAGNIPG